MDIDYFSNRELREMAEAGEPVEVSCHFCNTRYTFAPQELREILIRSGRG